MLAPTGATRAGYGSKAARKDLLAGVTVAAISLPQAMAYALIAGVDPRFGSPLFGDRRDHDRFDLRLVVPPDQWADELFSLVVFSSLAFLDLDARNDAYQATFLLALMAGSLHFIAVLRLGDLTRYISESVVLGLRRRRPAHRPGQTGNLLGPARIAGPGDQLVVQRVWLTSLALADVDASTARSRRRSRPLRRVGARRVIEKFGLPRMDMLVSLLVVSILAAVVGWTRTGPVGGTILDVIGRVPGGLPSPHIPEIKFWWVRQMSGSAAAIAVLGLLEALAIAKSIANQTGQKLDYNRRVRRRAGPTSEAGSSSACSAAGRRRAPRSTSSPGR